MVFVLSRVAANQYLLTFLFAVWDEDRVHLRNLVLEFVGNYIRTWDL